jgi:hypothetical protein
MFGASVAIVLKIVKGIPHRDLNWHLPGLLALEIDLRRALNLPVDSLEPA